MTILKDAQYWKEYNQKRREYLTQKERERRQKLKGVYNQEIKLELVQPESVQPTFSERVQPCTTFLSTTEHVQPKTEIHVQPQRVQPKSEKVVDIQTYNEEVFKRAGTREESRFFTFLDGRKIVRTKCGCNPVNNFYDWCLDNCSYFTGWRNSQIKSDDK